MSGEVLLPPVHVQTSAIIFPNMLSVFSQKFIRKVNMEEMLSFFNLELNDLHRKLFRYFDEDDSGQLNFAEFTCTIWNFLTAKKLGIIFFNMVSMKLYECLYTMFILFTYHEECINYDDWRVLTTIFISRLIQKQYFLQGDLHGNGVLRNKEMKELMQVVHSLKSLEQNKLMNAEYEKMKNGEYYCIHSNVHSFILFSFGNG